MKKRIDDQTPPPAAIGNGIPPPIGSKERAAHLRSCPACRTLAEQRRLLDRALAPPIPRPSFEDDLFANLVAATRTGGASPATATAQRRAVTGSPGTARGGRMMTLTAFWRPLTAVAATIPALLVSYLLARETLTPVGPSLTGETTQASVARPEAPDATTRLVAEASQLPAHSIKVDLETTTTVVHAVQPNHSRQSGFENLPRPTMAVRQDRERPSIAAELKKEDNTDMKRGTAPGDNNLAVGNMKALELSGNTRSAGAGTATDLDKNRASGTRRTMEADAIAARPQSSDKASTGAAGKNPSIALAEKRSATEIPARLAARPGNLEESAVARDSLRPLLTARIRVPEAFLDRLTDAAAAIKTALAAGSIPGTEVRIVPEIDRTKSAVQPDTTGFLPDGGGQAAVFVLWLLFETLVRIGNVLVGARQKNRRWPLCDTLAAALLGTLWLPVILSRFLAAHDKFHD